MENRTFYLFLVVIILSQFFLAGFLTQKFLPNLLLIFIVCLVYAGRTKDAVVAGLIGGLLFDLFSDRLLGSNSIALFGVIGFFLVLTNLWVTKGHGVAAILGSVALALPLMLVFQFALGLSTELVFHIKHDSLSTIIFQNFLIKEAASLAFTYPVLYATKVLLKNNDSPRSI